MGTYDPHQPNVNQLVNLIGLDSLFIHAPGLKNFKEKDLVQITKFVFIWMIFEDRLLNNRANPVLIKKVADKWTSEGLIRDDTFNDTLAYFKKRYFREGEFSEHFAHLRLPYNDDHCIVKDVLRGYDNRLRNVALTILLIVYRYRNNLLHGKKIEFHLSNQFDNFQHANGVLKWMIDKKLKIDKERERRVQAN